MKCLYQTGKEVSSANLVVHYSYHVQCTLYFDFQIAIDYRTQHSKIWPTAYGGSQCLFTFYRSIFLHRWVEFLGKYDGLKRKEISKTNAF